MCMPSRWRFQSETMCAPTRAKMTSAIHGIMVGTTGGTADTTTVITTTTTNPPTSVSVYRSPKELCKTDSTLAANPRISHLRLGKANFEMILFTFMEGTSALKENRVHESAVLRTAFPQLGEFMRLHLEIQCV